MPKLWNINVHGARDWEDEVNNLLPGPRLATPEILQRYIRRQVPRAYLTQRNRKLARTTLRSGSCSNKVELY
eukprot:296446-Amphidinium_carterae.1